MAKLQPHQAKANKFDKKRLAKEKADRLRKRFEAKLNAPYKWYVFPDWSFSFGGKLKVAESIIIEFSRPLPMKFIEQQLHYAFSKIND